MTMEDLGNRLGVLQSLSPAAYTSNQNSGANTNGAVDLGENEVFNGALAVISVGAWTDGTHTFAIEHADDDGTGAPDTSTWSEVPDTDLIGSEPVVDADADDEQVYKVGYLGDKRHVRVKVTATGTTSGAIYGAVFVLGAARSAPVTTGNF